MADGSSHPTLAPNWLLEEFGPPDADGTYGGLSIADMTHDFGRACGCCGVVYGSDRDINEDGFCFHCEAEEDPEDVYDASPAAMLREHGTWSG